MNLSFLIAVFGVLVASNVLEAQDCTSKITKCATAYNQTSSTIAPNDKATKCLALIAEYDCLKLCDAFCTGSDKSALDTALNSNVLPTLIQDCPGQVCEADIASCSKAYTNDQNKANNNQHLLCRAAAQFEVCLSNIQSVCQSDQQTQIAATLRQIRPTVTKACKGEDCQVQSKNCNDLWSQIINVGKASNNKHAACVGDMGLIICLQDIETECAPDQKAAIDVLLGPAKTNLDANCKGEGCSPKLIECTTNWNMSIMAATTLDAQCTADTAYEACLRGTEVLCTADEKNNVESLLKPIAPKIAQHCGVGDLKPLSFLTVLVAGVLLVKRFI